MTVLRYLLIFILSLLVTGWASAHPYHDSLAQITWNSATGSTAETLTGTLQIALKVIPEDLEAILSIHEGEDVILDDRTSTDKAIVDYLWQFFRVRDETGKQLPMQWLGKQVKHSAAWLYFEISIDHAKQLTLEDRVLMDYQLKQINRAAVNINGDKKTYTFTPQQSGADVIWPF